MCGDNIPPCLIPFDSCKVVPPHLMQKSWFLYQNMIILITYQGNPFYPIFENSFDTVCHGLHGLKLFVVVFFAHQCNCRTSTALTAGLRDQEQVEFNGKL